MNGEHRATTRDRDAGVQTDASASFLRQIARQRALPAMAYFALLAVLLQAYSWVRKTYFQRPPEIAFDHALDIIDLQARLGLGVDRIELPLQRWAIEQGWVIDAANLYYRQMKPALYIAFVLCLLLAPRAFPRIWRGFLIATLIALPCYALYPLAPPRLMEPFGFPFVDTLAVYGGVQSSAEGLGGANQFAAMPSMHIGWSLFAALWLAAALPWGRIGAVLGAAHVALMSLAVMMTANHYWLDIVAGAAVAGAGIGIARALPADLTRTVVAHIRSRTAASERLASAQRTARP